MFPFLFGTADPSNLVFVASKENDLYRATRIGGRRASRFDQVDEALRSCKPAWGLLILDGASLTQTQLLEAQSKHLRVYQELGFKAPKQKTVSIEWERAFVQSDALQAELRKDQILSVGRQKILAIDHVLSPLLSVGRVAGFDHLAFGPPKVSYPLLWKESSTLWESSLPLSQFSKARYSPSKAWKSVLKGILGFVGNGRTDIELQWTAEVSPTYRASEVLPPLSESIAVQRAADWFVRSGLIVDPNLQTEYDQADRWQDRVGTKPTGQGDGTLGVLEGFASAIDSKGNQPVRYYRRADCNAETAMALSFSSNPKIRQIGRRLAEYSAVTSKALHLDPTKQSYGLAGWNDLSANRGTFWGDDNARYILGLIGASGALGEHQWDDQIYRCILANFRTTGLDGFRGDNVIESDLERSGWRSYFTRNTINMAPHFESYLWACYLWAYGQSGYKPLLERAERAIRRTVLSGENAWTWTNGSQQERARMLLPLSWLVRVQDTQEHRVWLQQAIDKTLKNQDSCGAIREEIGDLSHGIAGPPRSNDQFGTAETPLIQENGDPLADMLYTSNFAFLGLHEASMVLNDSKIKDAENRLAAFLCRIQISSPTHPELAGAWFRAFDYGDWDYWASNADLGWGAWSIETGWSVAWISSVLALRERHQSLWAVHKGFHASGNILKEMLPDN